MMTLQSCIVNCDNNDNDGPWRMVVMDYGDADDEYHYIYHKDIGNDDDDHHDH